MAQYKIYDDTYHDPLVYMKTWNSTTGEVLTVTTEALQAFFFQTESAQNSAITLINGCSANTGKFIGRKPHPNV